MSRVTKLVPVAVLVVLVAVSTVVFVGCPRPRPTPKYDLTFQNASEVDADLVEGFIRAAGAANWGANQVGAPPVTPGNSYRVVDIAEGVYDLRAIVVVPDDDADDIELTAEALDVPLDGNSWIWTLNAVQVAVGQYDIESDLAIE